MWSRYKECEYSTKNISTVHMYEECDLRYEKCDYSAKKYIGRV